MEEKMEEKKKYPKKNLGKKKLGKKKNLGKKNLGKKKIAEKNWPLKGALPQKRHKLPKIGVFCFAGGDILKSCAQSKFETQWLKIALFRTAHTFWGPKMPQNRPIYGKKLEICTLPHFWPHYATYTWQIANVMYMRF